MTIGNVVQVPIYNVFQFNAIFSIQLHVVVSIFPLVSYSEYSTI